MVDERYELVERIGAGAMGTVYRARQTNIGRDIAIKLLNTTASADETLAKRFENEAKIISELRHPNTLKLIDFGTAPDGRLYVAVEYLSGRALSQILKQESMSPIRVCQILRQVSDSLAEAHAKGIIHRDLKPANIFVEEVEGEEVVKVLDFGIAQIGQQSTMTATGTVFGTPAYMSPEQAEGKRVDGRSDLYSLGVVAYQAIAGVRPFESETPLAMLLKHLNETPIHLRELLKPLPADLHPEMCDLIMCLLAKKPDDRIQSARHLSRALSRLERYMLTGDLPVTGEYPHLGPSEVISTDREAPIDPNAETNTAVADPTQAVEAAFDSGSMAVATEAGKKSWVPAVVIAGVAVSALGLFFALNSAPEEPPIVAPEVVVEPLPLPSPAPDPETHSAIPTVTKVAVETSPVGAVVVDAESGESLGTSPVTVEIEEGKSRRLTISLPGHLSQELTVDSASKDVRVELEKEPKVRRRRASPVAHTEPKPQPKPEPPKVKRTKRKATPLSKREVRPW